MGRPSKLTPQLIDMAIKLREEGMSIKKISELLCIDESTLYIREDWKALRKEMNNIKDIQEMKNAIKVKESLYKLATFHTVTKKTIYADANGNISQVVTVKEQKQPNEKAIEYYLNNKCPDEFKTNPTEQKTETTDDGTIKIQIVGGDE